MKIAFLTANDPTDRRSWSGTHYKMLQSLKQQFSEVVVLGPVTKPKLLDSILILIQKLSLKFFSSRYNKYHNFLSSIYYGKQFEKEIKGQNFDLIFAPAASNEIAFFKTEIPICYLSDTSFGQINNYYQVFSNLSKWSKWESNCVEKRAIKKSDRLVYSSEWAAQFVINEYNVNPNKVRVIPFGANIDFIPLKKEIEKNYSMQINLLFAAKEWHQKGGGIVLETFHILERNNKNIKLNILGCHPSVKGLGDNIQVIPFLNKNKPEEEKRFLNLFREAHLFFLPTRADCTPIVLCEANAFGIPVITTATGGVTSLVEDGANGFALPLDSGPEEYAAIIQELLDEPNKLKEMTEKARRKFEKELNWDNWAAEMKGVFLEMVKLKP